MTGISDDGMKCGKSDLKEYICRQILYVMERLTAFVSEHIDNCYIYEANVPVSDSIDERDVFLVNRSEFGQTLRVNKVFEEHSKEIKQTNRGVIIWE